MAHIFTINVMELSNDKPIFNNLMAWLEKHLSFIWLHMETIRSLERIPDFHKSNI